MAPLVVSEITSKQESSITNIGSTITKAVLAPDTSVYSLATVSGFNFFTNSWRSLSEKPLPHFVTI